MTLFDLYRIAKHLGIEMAGVIEKYGVCYIGASSRLPVVVMKMQGAERPFLKRIAAGSIRQNRQSVPFFHWAGLQRMTVIPQYAISSRTSAAVKRMNLTPLRNGWRVTALRRMRHGSGNGRR